MPNNKERNDAFIWSVLIIDDDEAWRYQAKILSEQVADDLGGQVHVVDVASIKEGVEAATSQLFHAILLDKQLQEGSEVVDGISFIPDLTTLQPMAQILMFTMDNDPRDVVRAMQLGATGYLVKQSGQDFAEYRKQQLRIALARARVTFDRERLARQKQQAEDEFVANSPVMKRLVSQFEALAPISKCILLMGDTGRGKGAAARKLHELRSKFLGRTDRPFLNINIATISHDLALNELFGHEPNSFTGAGNKVKPGLFELANDGDIFLDEIGETSLDLQAKLLKVIEERVFQRVGGTKFLKTNARMIFATNRDLKQMVTHGLFREDLYMRISTFTIELPPLEDRKEDIVDLVKVFLNRINRELSAPPIAFEELPEDFLSYLKRDHVPGNIRGLESDLTRLIVFSPNGKDGRPNFNLWRDVLGLSKRYVPRVKSPSGTISFEQFLNCPTDLLKPGFPGLSKVKAIFEQKLLNEAKLKYPSMTERAKVLGLQISNASRKYSLFEKDKKNRHEETAHEKDISNAPNRDRKTRLYEARS